MYYYNLDNDGYEMEGCDWNKVMKAEEYRQVNKQEHSLRLYAHKPEVEFEIEKILSSLLLGTAYIEKGR
jgi:hypothetical protein